MKNNVYVRSKKSILSISCVRMLTLLPLVIYGFYKNGISLYLNKYVNIMGLFRPLIFIITGMFIGALVNIIYEYLIKKSKDNIIDVLFSSFHIEYGMLIGMIVSINTNMLVFIATLSVLFLLSKFTKNRFNLLCICFIVIYLVSEYVLGGFNYLNLYESSKNLSYNVLDFMIGKNVGGIASTHIVLTIIGLIILGITNNNKSIISVNALVTCFVLFSIYCIFANKNIGDVFLNYGYIFAFSYVATDSVTSSYTILGMRLFGLFVGLITFGLFFVNPVLAPFISILIVSLFNNLLDRSNKIFNKKGE